MNARPIKKSELDALESGEDGHGDHMQPGPFAGPIEPAVQDLALALLALDTVEEACSFLRDLCTPAEINALSERWHVARLLDQGELSYRDIHDRTGVSTTTVSRVARFLFNEPHRGYRLVLGRIEGQDDGQKSSQDRNSKVGQAGR